MTLKNDAKLEKKWLFSKTPDEFGKFSPGHSKVSKLELWGNHLIQNRKCIRLKSTMKNGAKLGQELTFHCKTDMSNLTNFDPSTRKSHLHLMGFFWLKYIMFDLKKCRGVMFYDTEEWCKIWRKSVLRLGNGQEKFGKFSPEHWKSS